MLNTPDAGTMIEQSYLASMLNLAFTGLSENWLLKECGHQHWLALAQLHDRPLPDFRDDRARTAYAAFTAVRCWDLDLSRVVENRTFRIRTRLVRSGQARHASEHQVLLGERVVARLALISTFVSRHTPGDNRSVNKACLAGAVAQVSDVPAALASLHADNRSLRSGEWPVHQGLQRETYRLVGTYDFSPCPDVDYNGAGFLYFANVQALVDRAEWVLLAPRRPGQSLRRELHYYANLNVGDSVQVKLYSPSSTDNSRHWCELLRRSDQRKLADVFTDKHYSAHCSAP